MQKLIVSILIILLGLPVIASSINPALYQTMRASSYRNNYNRQVNNRPMPYWQAQSNYMTRGRVYGNYSNYNNYMYQHNSSVKSVRSYR